MKINAGKRLQAKDFDPESEFQEWVEKPSKGQSIRTCFYNLGLFFNAIAKNGMVEDKSVETFLQKEFNKVDDCLEGFAVVENALYNSFNVDLIEPKYKAKIERAFKEASWNYMGYIDGLLEDISTSIPIENFIARWNNIIQNSSDTFGNAKDYR